MYHSNCICKEQDIGSYVSLCIYTLFPEPAKELPIASTLGPRFLRPALLSSRIK